MQVWAGSICAGPDKVKISATYEQSQKVEFQDSVGASIAAIAATVPDGLLVFLPSYSMLDRLMERWKVRGGLPHVYNTPLSNCILLIQYIAQCSTLLAKKARPCVAESIH